MSAQDWLDRADALAADATEGPWDHEPWGGENQNGDLSGGNVFDGAGEYLVSEMSDADGAFIAACRTLVPAMSAALRAVLDRCQSIEADARAGQKYAGQVNNGALFMAESSRETTAREIRVTVHRSLGGSP